MRFPGARTLRLAVLAPACFAGGCSAIWIRGIVRNESGEFLPGASARVTAGPEAIASTPTGGYGCLLIAHSVPKNVRHFRLEVAAPGYKAATFDFELDTPVLVATLAPSSSEAQSTLRPATNSERADLWQAYCDPPLPPGAQTLGP
jgi:hypothetical protein